MANTIAISVIGDVKDINNKLGDVDKKLGGFSKSIGKVGGLLKGALVFAGGAAVVGQFKSIVDAGSDLNETMSKSSTIFGPAAKDIENFGNKAAKSLGLSKEQAIAGAAQFGNFFDQIGIGKKASADMSKSLLTMSADLASFNNADPSAVMEAFQSATRGEYDSLQQFIPTINAAAVQTEALRLTHKKSAATLTDADKANALYSLSVKGMGKAQGDFKRTSGGLANQQRIFSASIQDVKAKLGTALLPIMTKVMSFIVSTGIPAVEGLVQKIIPLAQNIGGKLSAGFQVILPYLQQFGSYITGTLIPGVQSFFGFIKDNAAVFAPIAVAIGAIVAAFTLYKAAMTVVSAVTKAYTAVQAALNFVMSLNPIGILVLAIVGLIAAFIYLWKTNDGFRNALITAWNAVKGAVVTAVNAVKNAAVTAWNFIKSTSITVFNAVKNFIVGVWNKIKSTTSSVWNSIKSFISTVWNGIKSGVSTAVNAVKSFISNGLNAYKNLWVNGWNTIKNFVTTAWSNIKKGVTTGISGMVSIVRGIPGKITGAVGNLGNLLKNAGRQVINGLIGGITEKIGALKSKLSGVTNIIPDWKGPLDKDKKLLTPAGQAIMDGLIKGIDKKLPALKKTLKGVSSTIAGGVDAEFAPGFKTGTLTIPLSRHGASVNNYVTVNAPVGSSPALIGKTIQENLQAYTNTYGKAGMRNLI